MKPLWTPSRERAQDSELARFMKLAGKTSYEELHRWSIERSADFWELVWRFAEVRGEMGDRRLIDADRMPGARWFPDARLNYAENLLRERDAAPAITFWGEDRVKRRLSKRQLYDLVSRIAQALADAGVKKGDRVAGYLPNVPEATAALLATAGVTAAAADLETVVCGKLTPEAKALVEDAKRFLAESKKHHADARAKIDHANAMWKARAALAEAESAAAISTP